MALKLTMAKVLILICFLFSVNTHAQEDIFLSIGKTLEVPLMGYNSDMSNTPKWSEPNFSQALKNLHPKTLRYPGGSNSAYWNWQKGWTISYAQLLPILQESNFKFNGKYIQNTAELKKLTIDNRRSNSFWRQLYRYNAKSPKYNTIDEFSKGLKANNAYGVFTLNTVTSNLTSEIGMLKEVIKNGIELKYIELGNEVYAENLLTKHIYPSVENYIDTCLKWSEAIWKEFPDVHIGVVGGDKNKRTRHWNEKLSLALQNKFPKNKLSQLHFILHYYSYFKHPEFNFNTVNGYQKLVAFPKMDLEVKLKNWKWHKTNLFSTWVTEFNMIEKQPYTINNKWVHALLISSQINQLLKQTQSEMFHFHSIGAESFPVFSALNLINKGNNYLKPTAAGIVTSLWNKLTQNADEFYEINTNSKEWKIQYESKSKANPNNPREEKNITFSPIHAYLSYENEKAKLLMVNLSNKKINVNLKSVIKNCKMEQHFATPEQTTFKVRKEKVQELAELAPYSISLLEE